MKTILKITFYIFIIFIYLCFVYYSFITSAFKGALWFAEFYDIYVSFFKYLLNWFITYFSGLDFIAYDNFNKYFLLYKKSYFHVKNQFLFMGYHDTFFVNKNYLFTFDYKYKYWFYPDKHWRLVSYSNYMWLDFDQRIVKAYKIYTDLYKQLGLVRIKDSLKFYNKRMPTMYFPKLYSKQMDLVDWSELTDKILKKLTGRYRLRHHRIDWTVSYYMFYNPAFAFYYISKYTLILGNFIKFLSIFAMGFAMLFKINYFYFIILSFCVYFYSLYKGFYTMYFRAHFLNIKKLRFNGYILFIIILACLYLNTNYTHFNFWLLISFLLVYVPIVAKAHDLVPILNKHLINTIFFCGWLLRGFWKILEFIYIKSFHKIFSKLVWYNSVLTVMLNYIKKIKRSKRYKKFIQFLYKGYRYFIYFLNLRFSYFKLVYFGDSYIKMVFLFRRFNDSAFYYYPSTIWQGFRVFSSYSPKHYSYFYIPTMLFLSEGGLWLRSYTKEISKVVFFINKDYLRFINFGDSFKNYIWEPYSMYNMHILDRMLESESKHKLFWLRFFGAVRNVFNTTSQSINDFSSYLSHYEFLSNYTNIYSLIFLTSKFKLLIKFQLFFAYYFINYVKPLFLDIFYKFLNLVINSLSLFFVGFASFYKEFYFFKNDPLYLPYLRTVSFYGLSGYKYLDLYSKYNSMVFSSSSTRLFQDLSVVSRDNWLFSFKTYDYTDSGYIAVSGHMFHYLVYLVAFFSFRAAVLSGHLIGKIHFGYFVLLFGSFLYKFWFFSYFFDKLSSFLNIYYSHRQLITSRYDLHKVPMPIYVWRFYIYDRFHRGSKYKIRKGRLIQFSRNYNLSDYL